nr:MAG TPA: hypothetical protein [Caudoviricetes sp.]
MYKDLLVQFITSLSLSLIVLYYSLTVMSTVFL